MKYRFQDFELDPASRDLRRRGERVALPPKSLDCLAYLLLHRERAVGRDELIAAVWGRVEVSDMVVAQTLLRARKALGDSGTLQSTIRTVTRFGYQWIAPVQELGQSVLSAPPPSRTTAERGLRHANCHQDDAPEWSNLILLVAVAAFAGWLLPGGPLRLDQPSRAVRAPDSIAMDAQDALTSRDTSGRSLHCVAERP